MKKILKTALIIILIAILIVGGYFLALNLTRKSALEAIDGMFAAVKTGDEEQMKKYINSEKLTEEEKEATDTEGTEDKDMVKAMLKNLNYEVVSTDVKINKCIVKLKVSNKDLKTVFSNYMAKAFSLAFSQAFGGMTEEEMNNQLKQYFEEQYNSDSVGTITSDLTINMEKQKEWKLDYNEDELVNAVLPGYKEVMNSMNNINE